MDKYTFEMIFISSMEKYFMYMFYILSYLSLTENFRNSFPFPAVLMQGQAISCTSPPASTSSCEIGSSLEQISNEHNVQ